ncbi:MAG: hypothetical protein ACR9NN_11390 [Nostochopsis sp.]
MSIRCNERRYNFTKGTDPQTQKIVPLFNPRQQLWSEHFIWTVDGLDIIGNTPVGRATCDRLDINDESHDQGAIRDARRFWVQAGWHIHLRTILVNQLEYISTVVN